MRLLTEDRIFPAGERTVLALGMFDGVHIGHGALIAEAREIARIRGAQAVIATFRENPVQVLHPGRAATYLQTPAERVRSMALWQPDVIVMRVFDHAFADTSPEAFVRTLVTCYHPTDVVVGFNYTFGKHGKGTPNLLWDLGKQLGFDTHVLPPVHCEGKPVSSTRIREALQCGDVVLAEHLLGRAYAVTGRVESGKRLGRTLGFPTANLPVEAGRVKLARGVYVARVVLMEGAEYPAVLNLGAHPTLPEGPQTLEAHLLDFEGDLYGRTVRVSFLRHLRAEQAFPSVDALRRQIALDAANARAFFGMQPLLESES